MTRAFATVLGVLMDGLLMLICMMGIVALIGILCVEAMIRGWRNTAPALKWASLGIGVALLLLMVVASNGALAQHAGRHHPPQDSALHDRFYSSWMRPDNRNVSCCNKTDCYPTKARMTEFGTWEAQRREDGKWLNVPPQTVETERDNPDGRPHLCAPPPEREAAYRNGVICFIAGAGI